MALRLLALAVLVYCVICGILIYQDPGLQYDESLLVLNAVQLRHSLTELPLPHDPHTWFCMRGRCLPLMTVRYVGAIKEYLCLPLFAVFGTTAEVVRGVSVFMGAIGIFGLGWLLCKRVSLACGVATAFALAVHPAYVDLTVFDNGTVAVWMAAMGLVALALAEFGIGLALGIAIGLGIWARSNFLWFVGAGVVAALICRVRLHGIVRLVCGVLLGASPWILYQIISGGGTFEAAGMFTVHDSWGTLLSSRFAMLAETLISDREHRFIWAGPEVPASQSWPLILVSFGACGYCLWKGGWARAFAVTFLVFGGMYFFTRLPVAEHHLLALIPLVVAMVAMLPARVSLGIGVFYLSCALDWQVAAMRGIAETGGVGQWSDGIYSLVSYLESNAKGREVQILDWGLQNSIFVLSDASVRSREVFEKRDFSDDVARGGGIFVMNAPGNRFFPEATEAFLKALPGSGVKRLKVGEFAEIVEIAPRAK